MREYNELLYAKKFNNIQVDKFSELYNLSRLNHEEIENLNKPITSKEIESVIKKSPKKQKSTVKWPHR